ncbi:MAG: LysR family transcriptional regulator [Actinobacteria bacterium]|nr:LysR family transcriptional regulator [Actinomycetota bacterium]
MVTPSTSLERLRVFHAVSTSGTVAGAARSLGYTPSAVSQQLAALERESGVALVERSNRGVVLTPAGEVMARRSGEVLDLVRTAFEDVARAADRHHTTLSIASFPTAIPTLLMPVRQQLAPEIDIVVVDAEPEQALQLVEAHEADAAITDADAVDLRSTDLHRTLIRMDPLRLVTPQGRTVRSLGECAHDRWVLGGPHTRHGDAARRVCRAAGFEPNVIVETEDHHIAFDVVQAVGAVTLLPELALVDMPKGVVIAKKVDVGHVRRVEFVTRSTLRTNPAIVRFEQALTRATVRP